MPESVVRHGARVYLNRTDPVVSGLLAFNLYEHAETRFFLDELKPGQTVLDIGAHVGYFSALALSRVGPSGRVICVEPDPENLIHLERTLEANGRERASVAAVALGDETLRSTMYRNPDNSGDNRLYASSDVAGNAVDVPVVRGDELLAGMGVEVVHLIKIDVQGFEARALAGLERTLRNSPEVVILAEFWPWALEQAGTPALAYLRWLREAGFNVAELAKDGSTVAVSDDEDLIRRYPDRQYCNLVLRRQAV